MKKENVGNAVEIHQQNLFETDIQQGRRNFDVSAHGPQSAAAPEAARSRARHASGLACVQHGRLATKQEETRSPRYDGESGSYRRRLRAAGLCSAARSSSPSSSNRSIRISRGERRSTASRCRSPTASWQARRSRSRSPGRKPVWHLPRRGRWQRHQGRRRLARQARLAGDADVSELCQPNRV